MEITLNNQQKEVLIEVLNGLRKENTSAFYNVVASDILKKLNGVVEKECEYGHRCTSDCQMTKDCPCLNDHTCLMSPKEKLTDNN